jgi:cytochrome c-type protein NapB
MRDTNRVDQRGLRRTVMPLRTLPLLLLAAIGVVMAAEVNYPLDASGPDGRRPGGTLTQSMPAPPIANEENKDLKRERNYPDQPPTIPHTILGYQIDKNGNKCLSCHSRANSARTQATMISITHYMDRDGQALAAVSPRRYFCNQCHVPQTEVQPLVGNSFETIDKILQDDANAAQKP